MQVRFQGVTVFTVHPAPVVREQYGEAEKVKHLSAMERAQAQAAAEDNKLSVALTSRAEVGNSISFFPEHLRTGKPDRKTDLDDFSYHSTVVYGRDAQAILKKWGIKVKVKDPKALNEQKIMAGLQAQFPQDYSERLNEAVRAYVQLHHATGAKVKEHYIQLKDEATHS
jgi:hypothetical protein